MVILGSLVMVQRGQTVVVRFLDDYVGKVLRAGILWHLPITIRRTVSIAVRNFEANCPRGDDALVRRATAEWSIALTCRDNRELAVPAPAGTGGRGMGRGGSA